MGAAAIGAAGGVGLGLIKHNQDLAKYNRDKDLAANIEANSAWTNIHGKMPDAPQGRFASALQGGLSGLSMGQSLGGMGGAAAPQAPSAPTLFGPKQGFGQSPEGLSAWSQWANPANQE